MLFANNNHNRFVKTIQKTQKRMAIIKGGI